MTGKQNLAHLLNLVSDNCNKDGIQSKPNNLDTLRTIIMLKNLSYWIAISTQTKIKKKKMSNKKINSRNEFYYKWE